MKKAKAKTQRGVVVEESVLKRSRSLPSCVVACAMHPAQTNAEKKQRNIGEEGLKRERKRKRKREREREREITRFEIP